MIISINRAISITSIIYLILIFSFASGAIHALIEGGKTGRQTLLVPDRSTQSMTESVLGTLTFFLGLAGVFFVHKSSRPQAAKAQKMFFIAGFSLVAISMLAGFLLLDFKM